MKCYLEEKSEIFLFFSFLLLLKTRDIVTWSYKNIQNIIVSNASQASTAGKKKKDYSTLGITDSLC